MMMMIQGKRAIAFRTGKLEMKTTNDAVWSYVLFCCVRFMGGDDVSALSLFWICSVL